MQPKKPFKPSDNSDEKLMSAFQKCALDMRCSPDDTIDHPYSLLIDILLAAHITNVVDLNQIVGKAEFSDFRHASRKLSRAETNANRELDHNEDDYNQNHRDICRFVKEKLHFSKELNEAQITKEKLSKAFFEKHPALQHSYLDHKKSFGLPF